VKYAGRNETDSGERLTFVTSKPLGSYDFGGWTVTGDPHVDELEYSVIELDFNDSGGGSGTASLATGVVIDAESNAIALDRSPDTRMLFEDLQRLKSGY